VVRHNALVVSGDRFFRHPELKLLRESYAAALFAMIRSQGASRCEVKLEPVRSEFPDFQIRSEGMAFYFEQTEADQSGHHRGDEFRERDERIARGLSPVSPEPEGP
jgi:hypothetical protein